MLLNAIERIPEEFHNRLLDSLADLAKTGLAPEDQRQIADAIRQKVSLSRRYPDTDWSLSMTLRESMEKIGRAFEPDDPVVRHQWLFAEWPDHFEEERQTNDESQALLLEARRAALGEILAEDGLVGVERLAKIAEAPGAVGMVLADLCGDEFFSCILPTLLIIDDGKLQRFAKGFVWQRFRVQRWPWVDRIPLQEWSADVAADFLACLNFEPEAWERAAALGIATEDAYWRRTGAWNHELAESDVEYAASQLVARRRAIWAVQLIRTA